MLNMVRADAYRLFHSKGFYITQILLVAIVVFSISLEGVATILGGNDALSNFQNTNTKFAWNAVQSVKLMSSMASVLIYFLLPLFVMTIGFEFSRKIYKNPLSSGMSRFNYFCSKYGVFLLIELCQFIFFYLAIFITAGLKNGVGHVTARFIGKMLATIGIQFMAINAILAIGLLLMYVFFSTITAVLSTIIFPMIVTLAVELFPKSHWLKYFSFQSVIDSAYFTNYSTGGDIMKLLAASFGVILICLASAFLVFKRRDL